MDGELAASLRRLVADENEPTAEELADLLWMARIAGGAVPPPGTAGVDDEAPRGATGGLGAPGTGTPGGGAELPLHAASFAAAGPPAGGDGDLGRPQGAALVRVAGDTALDRPLDLARALRPLKRRTSSAGPPVLDEAATAQLVGDTSVLVPAWSPRTERLFVLDLVIDTGPSMTVWRRLAAELRELLENHGAFRVVRTWSLDTGAQVPRLTVFHRTPSRTRRRTLPPEHLADPSGRRLLLFLTDGVGPLWRGPVLPAALARWAMGGPTAIVQVLPPALWHRTRLTPEPALAHATPPGRRTPLIRPAVRTRTAPGAGPWVPVLHLDADWLAPWARLAAGEAAGWTPVMAVRVGPERGAEGAAGHAAGDAGDAAGDAAGGAGGDVGDAGGAAAGNSAVLEPEGADLVERFRGDASPGAFELAGYLAAVPLVLPVMRLVQRTMMPGSGTAHLAEVLLSGLVVPAEEEPPAPGGDPELTLYDFRPGVRESLLDTLTRSESLRVLDVVGRVSGTVAARLGSTTDFRALLPSPDPSSSWHLPAASRPFARVTAAVLSGLGAEYASAARRLAEAAQAPAAAVGPETPPAAGNGAAPTAAEAAEAASGTEAVLPDAEAAAGPPAAEEPAVAPPAPEEVAPAIQDEPGAGDAPDGAGRPGRRAPRTGPGAEGITPDPSASPVGVAVLESDPALTVAQAALAATVSLHGPGRGRPFLGSGFFVAPGWVLTCAHVACATPWDAGAAAEAGVWQREVTVGWNGRTLAGVVEWAEPATGDTGGNWPAPDLALVRLIDVVDHPCVWLSERTRRGYPTRPIRYAGWARLEGQLQPFTGRTNVTGQVYSSGMLRLDSMDALPPGVSGGPLLDLERAEVFGVVKARARGQDGGLAVDIQQLRRMPLPRGTSADLYGHVMTAHDLYHARQHATTFRGQGVTWTDIQADIGACAGRALTAGQRTRLLGLLAQLPPPLDARSLMDIVVEAGNSSPRSLPIAPRAWREGLGALYGIRRGSELEAVLRFAAHAATAEQSGAVDEAAGRAVWSWVQEMATGADGLSRDFRAALAEERRVRMRAQVPSRRDTAGDRRLRSSVLAEIIPRGWEPHRCDWRVSTLPYGGEPEIVEEGFEGTELAALPQHMREALLEAFRRCDTSDGPATLEMAVPGRLLGMPFENWQLGPSEGPIGARRAVVVRPTDTFAEERPAHLDGRRWAAQHSGPLGVAVVDERDVADFLPWSPRWQELADEEVPVTCDARVQAPLALRASGFPVVLWRRSRLPPGELAEFTREVSRLVRTARTADGLLDALTATRARVAEGTPDAAWARDLALLYDDPHRPLHGDPLGLQAP